MLAKIGLDVSLNIMNIFCFNEEIIEALPKKLCIFFVFENPQNEQGGKSQIVLQLQLGSFFFFFFNFLNIF